MMNSKSKKIKKETIIYNNKNVGFSITIPHSWLEVKKTSYSDLGINDNTLFVFVADKFTTVTAIFSGFCKKRSFNKFFDKVKLQDDLKVIKTGQKEYNNISVKYIIVQANDKKIMHNFCLINEMIINFTINLDPKGKLVDNKGITNDSNFKLINEVLKNIEVYKPVNPPILVEDIEIKKEEESDIIINKNVAQLYIENDCKYKNILIPNFFFKYVYENNCSDVILSVINNETYFKGLNDCFRIIKVDEDLSNKIHDVLEEKLDELVSINSNDKLNSNSYIVTKINDKYLYIDLSNNDNLGKATSILEEIIEIISIITKKDFSNYDLIPNTKIKTIFSNEVGKEAESILRKLEIELKEMEHLKKESSPEQVVISEKVGKEAAEILKKLNAQIESMKSKNEEVVISDEVGKEAEIILIKLEREIENLKNPNHDAEMVSTIITKEAEAVLNKLENEDKYQEHQRNQEKKEYDLTEFEEFYHNVDGHASFKFLFPKNSGEKVIRDFNVFDIDNDDEVNYRVFMFKCETIDKYEAKLENWMNMNITSNQCNIKEKYRQKTEDNLEIRTYIFENGKFYKVAYIHEYLIAISGIEDADKLFYADIALNNVEIGADSKAFIEAYDRKMHSIRILEAQGIPYLEELPVIASSYEITGKTLDEIAKRAIVLCISCNFASDILSNKKRRYLKESKKFFNKLLDTFNVKDVMTKDEKTLFDKMDKKIAIQISWQFEGYVILLWTLGLIDEITFPDTLVDPDFVTAVVSSCDSYREFIEKCSLRMVNEVLDLADLTYRYNWYCVEAKINDEEPVVNPEIVMERHRALNWLLSDQKWDKVEINT